MNTGRLVKIYFSLTPFLLYYDYFLFQTIQSIFVVNHSVKKIVYFTTSSFILWIWKRTKDDFHPTQCRHNDITDDLLKLCIISVYLVSMSTQSHTKALIYMYIYIYNIYTVSTALKILCKPCSLQRIIAVFRYDITSLRVKSIEYSPTKLIKQNKLNGCVQRRGHVDRWFRRISMTGCVCVAVVCVCAMVRECRYLRKSKVDLCWIDKYIYTSDYDFNYDCCLTKYVYFILLIGFVVS